MENKDMKNKKIVLQSNLENILNTSQLEKVGAGHDGIIFQYNNIALKLLKYDINLRREKSLMTFEKMLYFINELSLKRIVKPIDIILDLEGMFCGYVMDFLNNLASEKKKGTSEYKAPGEFLCSYLDCASFELSEDFTILTNKKVIAKDINRGSYIYTEDFMHLCDLDKFIYPNNTTLSISDTNQKMLNYTIAKFLYYEMLKSGNFNKSEIKQISKWVKKATNNIMFINELSREISTSLSEPISEYAKTKVKSIIK